MVAVDILDRQLETDRCMTYLNDATAMFVHDKLSDIVSLCICRMRSFWMRNFNDSVIDVITSYL